MKTKSFFRALVISMLLTPAFFNLNVNAQSSSKPTDKGPVSKKDTGKVSFTIEGNLKNFRKKAIVLLGWREPWEDKEFLKADVIDGKFTLTGKTSQPTTARLRIITFNDSLQEEQRFPWDCDRTTFFICGGKTSITGTDSLRTAKISGCKETAMMRDFDSTLNVYNNEESSIIADLQKAYARKDTCAAKTLLNALEVFQYKTQQVYTSYILEHPSSYLSVNLLNSYAYQLKDKAGWTLALSILRKLPAHLQSSPLALALKERVENQLYSLVGTSMPLISLKDTSGVTTDFAKFKGKLLLVDFWASWCSPCREKFPKLLTLYEKYKDQGFEIVGISIDGFKHKWMDAINKDKVTWPQFLDEGPAYGGKAGRLYRIKKLPASFWVNKEGIIVAEHLTIEQIEARLQKAFAGK